jgi:uncharacterized protein
VCPTQASRNGVASSAAQPPAVASTPRLLRSAYGWWFLGGRGRVLLRPEAVDGSGRLDPIVELQMRSAGQYEAVTVRAYALTALATTACNLGCGYCFQNVTPGGYGGSRPPRIAETSMSRQTARETVEFAAARMAETGLAALDVHITGGEPLLNPAGCRDLLEFAQRHGLRAGRLTTNGTLLTTSLAAELAGVGLRTVRVTFDGRRADHDRVRVRRSGGAGSFDVIVARLARACEATALRFDLRVNVSQRNRAGLHELVDQLAERVDPARCGLAFDPLRGGPAVGAPARGAALADEFLAWIGHAAERGFRLRPPGPHRPCRTCTIHNGQLGAVVSADGILYASQEMAGRRGWALGTVCTGFRPADEVAARRSGCPLTDRAPEAAVAREFQDAVDGRVLDYLHDTDRLSMAG